MSSKKESLPRTLTLPSFSTGGGDGRPHVLEASELTRVFGAINRHGEHVVFLQHFDRPFGAPGCCRNEERRLPFVAQAANLRHPVGHPPFELDGRLRTNMYAFSPVAGT